MQAATERTPYDVRNERGPFAAPPDRCPPGRGEAGHVAPAGLPPRRRRDAPGRLPDRTAEAVGRVGAGYLHCQRLPPGEGGWPSMTVPPSEPRSGGGAGERLPDTPSRTPHDRGSRDK